ncbi:hypothetical protein NCH01_11160 [Neoasaia chiangmaiensis]|nr:hypothetical protein NCH01_11160 [Neoasaia chiangmaiensis]
MALEKNVTDPVTGVSASYWAIREDKIMGAPVNRRQVWLGGYDGSAAVGISPARLNLWFQFAASDLGVSDVSEASWAQIYAAILALANAASDNAVSLDVSALAGAQTV